MEPISAAMAAFGAVKAGITAGKELHTLAKDLGKMWDAVDEVNRDHSKKRNRQVLSVNEEALSTFVAKQQAKDLEEELRELIIWTRGQSAWHELLQLRVDIRNERKEAERAEQKRRQEKMEAIIVVGGAALGAAICIGGLIALVLNYR
tara:strand:+ start:365 stop:808 length:444 start_codon:yes stop_codon:yes gene_type:complete